MPHGAALRSLRSLRVESWSYQPAPPSKPKNVTPKLVAVTAMDTPSSRPRMRRNPPPSLNAKPKPSTTIARMHSALATGPVKLASTWFSGPSHGRALLPLPLVEAARVACGKLRSVSTPTTAGATIERRWRKNDRLFMVRLLIGHNTPDHLIHSN